LVARRALDLTDEVVGRELTSAVHAALEPRSKKPALESGARDILDVEHPGLQAIVSIEKALDQASKAAVAASVAGDSDVGQA
jgi:hypothetical protein